MSDNRAIAMSFVEPASKKLEHMTGRFDDSSHFVHVIDTHYVWAACARIIMQKYYSMNVNCFLKNICKKKYICRETGKMYFEESLRGGNDVKNLEIFSMNNCKTMNLDFV